jgi:uncharacterized protein Yka (UPF0111/DUF47 family)
MLHYQVATTNTLTVDVTADLNANVDQLGALLADIAALEKQAEEIKKSIRSQSAATGIKKFQGDLFNATVVEQDRTSVDYKKLIEDLGGIDEETLKRYTKTTNVVSVKVTSL